MKILIIGGTQFVGRHLTESALAAGHDVTLFHRGKTNKGLYPQAEEIFGDRDGGLDALDGQSWDVVFDTCGYVPRVVRQSAEALRDRVGRYVFVSSISVYADMVNNTDEDDAPLQTLEDETVEEITGATYGGLKVLCENVVTETYGDRGLNLRPGFIVGRYDPIARLPYLVHRYMSDGERLAGPSEQPVQVIHARDLGDWMVAAAEAELGGAYNLTGHPVTMSQLLAAIQAHTDESTSTTHVDDAFLQEHEMTPIDGLTYWVPGEMADIMRVNIDKALNTGLSVRSIEASVQDVADWLRETPEAANFESRTGGTLLTPDREAELLAAWFDAG
jgi:2'-hydroxyisoflavone reductase